MMNKRIFSLLLVLSLLLALAGCGASGDNKAEVSQETGLRSWVMNATTWSSPNGATVNLTAIPNGYTEGQSADFVVRLEGEQVEKLSCNWDGTSYTASADLNAADGYCYYVVLTEANGTVTEIPVNTPNALLDESLINLKTSLDSYCALVIDAADTTGGTLTVTSGTAQLQMPQLTLAEGAFSCRNASLVMYYNGEAVGSETLAITESNASGLAKLNVNGVSFPIPAAMEDDQQLSLVLEVTLSNGQSLTAPGGTWFYLDGSLLLAAG